MTAAFTKDRGAREVMTGCVWKGKGLPLIEAVGWCFGSVGALDHELEFLSDNVGACIAADQALYCE